VHDILPHRTTTVNIALIGKQFGDHLQAQAHEHHGYQDNWQLFSSPQAWVPSCRHLPERYLQLFCQQSNSHRSLQIPTHQQYTTCCSLYLIIWHSLLITGVEQNLLMFDVALHFAFTSRFPHLTACHAVPAESISRACCTTLGLDAMMVGAAWCRP
jgi:hypothetical protein